MVVKKLRNLFMKAGMLFALLLSLSVFTNLKTVDAKSLSEYAKELNELQTTDLVGGVTLYKQQIATLYDGIKASDGRTEKWNPHTVQWVDLPTSSEDVKVVTWSAGNKHSFASSTVKRTAEDYEKNHPGWSVVAAINGDFFDINGTKEPSNLAIQDGHVIQTEINDNPTRGNIGINFDGSVIVGKATIDAFTTLQIINGGKVVENIRLSAVNSAPAAEGITLITKDSAVSPDLTGYKVYKCHYDFNRISRFNSGVFVSGNVESVETGLGSSSTPDVNYFYLASKDGSLDSISTDAKVVCQQRTNGLWSNVESSVGYIYQILTNGTPNYRANSINGGSAGDFISTTHPRTFLGFKEDGSTVMMVTEGRGKESDCQIGTSLFQGGELMRLAGCTSAYNLDGGGSSTLVVKNAMGGFDVVNRPSDGSERSIGNAVLFVQRTPGFNIDSTKTTRNSINITINDSLISNVIQDIVIKVNGKTYKMTESSLDIPNLEENTEYSFDIEYKVPDSYSEKLVTGKWKLVASTKGFDMPNPGLKIDNITDTSISFIKEDYTTASWIKDVVVHIGDSTYQMNDKNEFTVDTLYKDTEYVIYFEYNVLDPLTGKTYYGVTEEIKIRTLSFTVPSISQFEESRVNGDEYTFRYRFKDDDGVFTKAYVLVNNVKYEIDTLSGTVSVVLNRTETAYDIKLVIEYSVAEETKQISSNTIHYDIVEKTPEPAKGCKVPFFNTFITSVSMFTLALTLLRKKH